MKCFLEHATPTANDLKPCHICNAVKIKSK